MNERLLIRTAGACFLLAGFFGFASAAFYEHGHEAFSFVAGAIGFLFLLSSFITACLILDDE